MLVLPGDAQGLHWKEPWSGLGMRGNSSRDFLLDGTRIPRKNLLGQEGDQIWYVFEVVAPFFAMAMAGVYLGIAESALQDVIARMKQRTYSHSGAGQASVAILQHRLGTIWSRLESARQLVYSAGRMADEGRPEALPSVLSAKAEVADVAVYVVNEAMTLLGGRGFVHEGKAGRLLRDVRAAQVMAPTTDMLRTWTGRALLGLPLLSGE
jgi:alkylation response protein AidB-like acyl-CoA dehydrogenase